MQSAGTVEVRFIAGFGPIVRDSASSRRLYADDLAISFKEEMGGYLYRGAEGRENLCSLAVTAGGTVLFRQRRSAAPNRGSALRLVTGRKPTGHDLAPRSAYMRCIRSL